MRNFMILGQKDHQFSRKRNIDIEDDDDNDDDDDDDGRTKDRIALSFEDIKGLRVSLNLELGMRQVYESIVEDAIEEQIQEDVTGERGEQN